MAKESSVPFQGLTRLPLRLAIFSACLCSLAPAAAHADSRSGLSKEWASFWDDCHDLNLPNFQGKIADFVKLLRAGSSWDNALELEKVKVQKLNKEVCAKWGQSENGEAYLKEFVAAFGEVATTGIQLKKQIEKGIAPQLDYWIKAERQELRPFGFMLEDFPCGAGFARTQKHIQKQLQVLEKSIDSIGTECTAAADAIIAEAVSRGLKVPKTTNFGNGGRKLSSEKDKNHDKQESDLTGVGDALEDEAKTQKILQQQNEAARKELQKK